MQLGSRTTSSGGLILGNSSGSGDIMTRPLMHAKWEAQKRRSMYSPYSAVARLNCIRERAYSCLLNANTVGDTRSNGMRMRSGSSNRVSARALRQSNLHILAEEKGRFRVDS